MSKFPSTPWASVSSSVTERWDLISEAPFLRDISQMMSPLRDPHLALEFSQSYKGLCVFQGPPLSGSPPASLKTEDPISFSTLSQHLKPSTQQQSWKCSCCLWGSSYGGACVSLSCQVPSGVRAQGQWSHLAQEHRLPLGGFQMTLRVSRGK